MALALATAPAAAAQDAYRQTVVVTAAATPVELGTVSRSVVVITREQLLALPLASVADVLRLASSVDVRARGERGVQSDFAVRGAGFGQMLVLVDGVRINDAQSGHHNGDIPVPLDLIERVEILYGAGSSLFGADAFGGTVNIITRREPSGPSLAMGGGSFGSAQLSASGGGSSGGVTEMAGGSFDRSGGFIDGRDFKTALLHSRTAIGSSSSLSVSYLWKEFGARNFYGAAATGDAMSREWTNQTLIAGDHIFGVVGGWRLTGDASYRTARRPFRVHAGVAGQRASHARSARFSGGIARRHTRWHRDRGRGRRRDVDPLQQPWRSHRCSGSAASGSGGSLRVRGRSSMPVFVSIATRSSAPRGALSAGVSWWAAPRIRVRASGGRAFRVPTFTERYYSDRNHLARPGVGPEHSWSGEGGIDLFPGGAWLVQATAFGRSDHDVIDWLCANQSCGTPTATERWHTFNVRDVDTKGVEVSVRRTFGRRAFVQGGYTGLVVDAPDITQMSKYVLDYTPRSFAAAGVVPVGRRSAGCATARISSPDPDDGLVGLRAARCAGVAPPRVRRTSWRSPGRMCSIPTTRKSPASACQAPR